MSDKKKNTPIYSVKKFITRLGAHYIHIAVYAVRRLPRPAFGKLTPKSHKEKRERKKLTLSTVGEIVFPAVCILGLCATVKHTLSQNYAVAVEIDGEDAGMVESGQVYGEACRIVAEKMDNYSTNGEYRRNAKLTLRPVTSEETVIDGLALASKMERSISDKYPLARPTRQVEEPEPDFASFITDKNDPDLIQAVMVKADGKVLGFVSS